MPDLPSGTVTLLFTDIEESTENVALVRASIDPERARVLGDEGRSMSTDDAVALALERWQP